VRLRSFLITFWCASALSAQTATIVSRVQVQAFAGNFDGARRELKQFRAASGVTPEYLDALSWLGRGELGAKNYTAAVEDAAEVRKLCLDQLTHRKLDAEPHLPMALGASIEVQALASAMQGRRDEAVLFLRDELRRWHDTSIRPRIQKNLNLLTLEGKPAPPLEIAQSITGRTPVPLARHRGHPVLLFFWAHWCIDCKMEASVIQQLEQTYGSRGLVVVAPTQHYGYVAGGQEAPREVETKYIKDVYAKYYAALGPVEVPLSEENFSNYGVSTTPTLVLVDAAGIVRLYNPGALSYEQLSAKIAQVFRAAPAPSE
jgi:cytochrome c biogenesis protein CcmG/thiol:disulfide interchange protein DsbE